jgi:hypothetical protein
MLIFDPGGLVECLFPHRKHSSYIQKFLPKASDFEKRAAEKFRRAPSSKAGFEIHTVQFSGILYILSVFNMETELTARLAKSDLLAELPIEIVLHVFDFLDFKSLLTAGLVSKNWYSFANDPAV